MGLDPMDPTLFWAVVLDASGMLGKLRFPPRKLDPVGGEVSNGMGSEGPVIMGRLGPPPNEGGEGAVSRGFPFCTPESGSSGPKL